ncbi:MAG TPA: VOC family protein [Patescibacteria group bacterium]|jgi:predicted 3-demethylubiquinone-9 3-methyltransferase (glyoxalase superfamily)|nr:VOC family protein [Patescibacteria group bacterium]
MQKIIPHLWFDKEAKEAAEFYTSAFPAANKSAKITSHKVLKGTPSGDTDMMSFEIEGQKFMSISAGPIFKINPSVSFMLNFDPSSDPNAEENLNKLWEKLSEGGKVMMDVGEYPFSKRYGFLEDKYGVSWQLILTRPEGEKRPFVVPSLLFVGPSYGKAKEAVDYYLSVFKDSKLGTRAMYETEMGPNKAGTVMFSDFNLLGEWLTAMDGGGEHKFNFNEGVSFMVYCENQEEIDYYWEKLSAVPQSEQCGWCKDKFGVSWQIVPTAMQKMMSEGTPEQSKRVTQAFLQMKKFDIAKLEEAYNG